MSENKAVCVYCGNDSSQYPLLQFMYKDNEFWICSQHLPVLIHEPAKLAEKMPGAEKLKGHQH